MTFLVGENGSGKSTMVEAVAEAYGLGAEGGSTGRPALDPAHRVAAGPARSGCSAGSGRARWGYFLRAETMHGFYSYLEENPSAASPRFHEMSHGESFLEVLRTRFDSPASTASTSPRPRCPSRRRWA